MLGGIVSSRRGRIPKIKKKTAKGKRKKRRKKMKKKCALKPGAMGPGIQPTESPKHSNMRSQMPLVRRQKSMQSRGWKKIRSSVPSKYHTLNQIQRPHTKKPLALSCINPHLSPVQVRRNHTRIQRKQAWLREMATIQIVKARQIFDSRGNPTVEVITIANFSIRDLLFS